MNNKSEFVYDSVILSENCTYSTDCELTQVNNNVIVCGGSGSGKTLSISEPRMLTTNNGTLITTLTKRKLFYKYSKMFENRGYVVEDMNFIEPEKSTISYDPIQYVKNTSDIVFLAEAIVMSNPKKEHTTADPYWDSNAISLLSSEISYVLETERRPSFLKVLKLHEKLMDPSGYKNISTEIREKFDRLYDRDPKSFACQCWKSFINVPENTAGCIYGSLQSVLDKIFTPEIRKMLNKAKKVKFEKLATRKTVLFISTSAVNQAMNAFVNLFYGQIFKTLFEFAESQVDGALPIPVHILADDFATGTRIPSFAEYISIFREKKISVTLLLQSESQLESIYGSTDTTTIINNCDSYVYLGGMDVRTAKNISEKANMPLDEVLYMPIGDEILLRRGQRPIYTRRYQTLEDELYQEVNKAYEEDMLIQEENLKTQEESAKTSRKRERWERNLNLFEGDLFSYLE